MLYGQMGEQDPVLHRLGLWSRDLRGQYVNASPSAFNLSSIIITYNIPLEKLILMPYVHNPF